MNINISNSYKWGYKGVPDNLCGIVSAYRILNNIWIYLSWLRSVSTISIFEFSIWESQIRTNELWMFFWHDIGFKCARVSAQNKHDEISEIDRIDKDYCSILYININIIMNITIDISVCICVYIYIYIYIHT